MRARAGQVGMGRTCPIDLRLPTGPLTTSTTRLPPFPPLPAHSPSALSPAPNRPGGRTARWLGGRSVDAAPLAPPASVGRNVYHASAAAHALRASRRQPGGARVHPVAGMRSDVLEPHRRAIGPQGR
jgi:hypothetical protein